ncbi:MAG: uroporphyrinogen-III synthase [Gammaproteobacteria bacterium]
MEGKTVLVTRPAHQSQRLCELIEAEGGRVVLLPTIEILDPQDINAARKVIDRLDEFDIAIFISTNAVSKTMELLSPRHDWPPRLKVAAVGARTAEELERRSRPVDIRPHQQFNSEALLALNMMRDVASKRIVIFRGEGGRELLGDTLRERGAHVEYAEVYRRGKPAADFSSVMDAGIDVIIVTSNESLRNLWEIAGETGREWLLYIPLVVISKRTADLAGELGFVCQPLIASEASDAGLVTAIKDWCNNEYVSSVNMT